MKRITMFLVAGMLFLSPMLYAAVPQLINFQGILRDGSGNPVADGSYSVTFTIYDAAAGGNNLWTETQPVNTNDGLFSVLLGSVTPVLDSIFNDSSRYLGVQVGADPEMTPRQRLATVPYSFNASSGFAGKVLNVTVRQNGTRTTLAAAVSITMESFLVDKKSPTSILLIQGTMSGFGAFAGSMTQGWKYGSGAEVIAQSIPYTGQIHSNIAQTSAVISGHSTTGPQILVFRYFAQDGSTGNRPFNVYNPNGTDDARLAQTKSVYLIWEVEP